MKHYLALTLLCLPMVSLANDSTGFVGTGGIQYLKSPHIAMQTEDLFISKMQIRVDYQFKNLSQHDITETILFPLPRVDDIEDSFADTESLVRSFKIWVNGKAVQPKVHVRAFLYPVNQQGERVNQPIDVTEILQRCGVSDADLMGVWQRKEHMGNVRQRVVQCQAPKLRQIHPKLSLENLDWATQIVYSWQQTFKAGEITHVKHQYTPLLGGSLYFDASKDPKNGFYRQYCVDDSFRAEIQRRYQKRDLLYSALSYVLTTGANWAKPIGKFTLTIERDSNELVSLCWDKSLKKVGANRFQAVKHDFLPKRDLDIVFVQPYSQE